MSSKCKISVNFSVRDQLVVIIKEEVVEQAEGCSVSYQLMGNHSFLHPIRSFCQLESGANTYTNFIFVRSNNSVAPIGTKSCKFGTCFSL